MASSWVGSGRGYYLRIFLISLGIVALCLAGFLFGVRLEATVPVRGTITARDLREVRTVVAGLIEPGWYEGEVSAKPGGRVVSVRLDSKYDNSDSVFDPASGLHGWVEDGGATLWRLIPESVRFHRLQAGDVLWPGQRLAALDNDETRLELRLLDDRIQQANKGSQPGLDVSEFERQRDRLRLQIERSVLRVPAGTERWLVLQPRAAHHQSVSTGDVIAVIVPIDATTQQPRDVLARLEVDEQHLGELAAGQVVRLRSATQSERSARTEARIDRIEPWPQLDADGKKRYGVFAAISPGTPFPLGSTCHADIIIGRKQVYRIILEH